MTNYRNELNELKSKDVKIYPFFVQNSIQLRIAFQNLAINSKKCQFLDVNNAANGAKDLLDTLAKVILSDIGGEKFEAKYDEKFKTRKLHFEVHRNTTKALQKTEFFSVFFVKANKPLF